jgi:hypothetical protein
MDSKLGFSYVRRHGNLMNKLPFVWGPRRMTPCYISYHVIKSSYSLPPTIDYPIMRGSYENIEAQINQNLYLSSPGWYIF